MTDEEQDHFVHRVHVVDQKVDYQYDGDGGLEAFDRVAEETVEVKATYKCNCGESFLKESKVIEHWEEAGWDYKSDLEGGMYFGNNFSEE